MSSIKLTTLITLFLLVWCCFAQQVDEAGLIIQETKQLKKQIFEEDYKLFEKDPNDQSRGELDDLVKELNALTFQSNMIRPIEKVEPNMVDINEPAEVNVIVEEFKLDENFKPDPNNVIELVGLADILYKDKLYANAGLYYKTALEKIESQQKGDLKQMAWILFQLGNCNKDDNPKEAFKYYDKLSVKFPGSKWAEICATQKKITELRIKEIDILNSITDKGD